MAKIIGATFRASVLALLVFTSEVPYSDAAGESNFVTYPTEQGAKPFGNAEPSTTAPASGPVARHPPKESRSLNNNFVSYPAAALHTDDNRFVRYPAVTSVTSVTSNERNTGFVSYPPPKPPIQMAEKTNDVTLYKRRGD